LVFFLWSTCNYILICPWILFPIILLDGFNSVSRECILYSQTRVVIGLMLSIIICNNQMLFNVTCNIKVIYVTNSTVCNTLL